MLENTFGNIRIAINFDIKNLSSIVMMKFPLLFFVCSLVTIMMGTNPSEGLITKLSAVNSRTRTIKTLYFLVRFTPDQLASDLRKIILNDDTEDIESEQTIDLETRNRICLSIMDHATEFGGDVYKARGDVFEELRRVGITDDMSWTPLGIEILALHLKDNVTVSKMTPEKLQYIREEIINSKKREECDGSDESKIFSGQGSTSTDPFSLIKNSVYPVLVYDSEANKWPIPEDVFTCPRQIGQTEIRMYSVSKEYNVNFESDASTNPIVARFLFARDKRGRNTLYAIAEEPAKPVLATDSEIDIEDLYIERRTGKDPAKSAPEDPICKLSESQMFRLCGLIFNSEYFEGKLKFPASYSVVAEYKCQEEPVSLKRREGEKGKLYKEWMGLCYISYSPFGYKPDQNLTYFVSRAYNQDTNKAISSNDIFLYGVENEKIVLINSFTNIRLDELFMR